MIRVARPAHVDGVTLHAEVDALNFGSYRIEWHADELVFVFDRQLSSRELASLAAVVEAHDGSEKLAARELETQRIASIQESNAALVASARAKRLAGEDLTAPELAAMVDLMLFPG
jgi:hypothetical protein